MKRDINKQPSTILSILLFCTAIMLSCGAFAGNIDKRGAFAENKGKHDDNINTPQTFEIGDQHAGGIVFYVTEDGQHGLIAALSDQSADIQWYNGVSKVTGATGDGIGAGVMNTTIIVAAQSNDDPGVDFAAKVAADYAVSEDGLTPCTDSTVAACYGDWYLPSKDELNLMYTNLHLQGLGGFADLNYWSSSEFSSVIAWGQNFLNGNKLIVSKLSTFDVRAVRAF